MPKARPSTRFVTPHRAAHQWPRRTSLPSVFTAFVQSLRGQETPDADLFHDAWHALRGALASELKRRGLWQSPPRYLGVFGWDRWDEEPAADPRFPNWTATRRQASALAELVADCYAFVFVERLPSLKRHLDDKPSIDGLILLNVRHFLHERQTAHDPLGYRVFELVHAAVADALARGVLHVLGGDARVRNDTVLGFSPGAAPAVSPPDLREIAVRWNDELVPDLASARGRRQAAVAKRLSRRLLELPRHGIEAFRFRDLMEPLKSDARRRWAALLDGVDPAGSEASRRGAARSLPVSPDTGVESRQSFEDFTRRVDASIRAIETDPQTRFQISVLWDYLRRHHGADGAGDSEPAADGERLESYRRLAARLKIPRGRFPRLFSTLRQLAERCRVTVR